MSKIVVNYDGGASDSYATFKQFNEAFTGQVFKGLDVVPNSTANMTVKVNTGSGRIPTGTPPSDFYYMVSVDTSGGESVTIATAASSPRIDYVVAYIDKSVAAVQSPVNNTNDVLKFVAISGTPATSPVVPTAAQIQSKVGAANPYIILAQVAVAANATTITTPNITDARVMVAPANGSVKGVSIDFTSITDQASGMPIFKKTGVAMGYGMSATLTRSGNQVIVSMNTVPSAVAAVDSTSLSETFPAGFRPAANTTGIVIGHGAVSTANQSGWLVNPNGSMTFSNINSVTGATRVYGTGTWFTDNAWPTS